MLLSFITSLGFPHRKNEFGLMATKASSIATCRLACRLWSLTGWAVNLLPLLTCCVLFDQSLKLTRPQFSHLKVCCNYHYLIGQMTGLMIYVKCPEGYLAQSKHSVNISLFFYYPALSCRLLGQGQAWPGLSYIVSMIISMGQCSS